MAEHCEKIRSPGYQLILLISPNAAIDWVGVGVWGVYGVMNGENILIREYLAEWDIVCHRAAAFSSLVKIKAEVS